MEYIALTPEYQEICHVGNISVYSRQRRHEMTLSLPQGERT